VGYDNVNAIKPMLADGRVLATVDQHAAEQAVFGIEIGLKALKTHKTQSDLGDVIGDTRGIDHGPLTCSCRSCSLLQHPHRRPR